MKRHLYFIKFRPIQFGLVLLLLCLFSPLNAQSAKTQYETILAESSLPEKRKLGKNLSNSKDNSAEKYIILLLNNKSYWNQYAGIEAAFPRKSKQLDATLAKTMATDHMVSGEIGKLVLSDPNRFESLLIENYIPGELSADDVLETLAKFDSSRSIQFIISRLKEGKSREKSDALQALKQADGPNASRILRNNLNDPELRLIALESIIRNGNQSDLPLFVNILNRGPGSDKEQQSEFFLAMEAHSKWARLSEKQTRYLEFLNLKEREDIALIAIATYHKKEILNPSILDQLQYYSARAKDTSLRLSASLALTDSLDRTIVPYLIESLNISYESRQSTTTGMDIAIGILAIGIVPALKGLSERNRYSSFHAKKAKISTHLRKITGQNFSTYEDWERWAIANGYTINGINLAGQLYSGNSDIKQQAIRMALTALGFSSEKEFRKKNNVSGPIHSALANQLESSGFLIPKEH